MRYREVVASWLFGGLQESVETWACRKTIVFTIALALAARAQRIETEKSDRHKVIRVETAPNHLSVIELAEPVTEVAAGSSSYKIEWRGNKVFVQPLDPRSNDEPIHLDGLRAFEL